MKGHRVWGARAALALAVALMLEPAGSASAEIYQWKDADGRIHYTADLSQVPPAKRSQARDAANAPKAESRVQTYRAPGRDAGSGARSRRARSSRPRPGGVLQIPFRRQGTLMVVDVKLNDRVTAPFLVDTGASGVAIPYAVSQQLGINIGPETPRVRVNTANGSVMEPIVMLDAVQVGGARVEGLEANISGSMRIGLLGGTFFNNFVYQVDAGAQVISLVPNEGVRGGLSADQWSQRFGYLRGLLADLDQHLSNGQIVSKDRVRELEERREALLAKLDELDLRADRAQVPHEWRQ